MLATGLFSGTTSLKPDCIPARSDKFAPGGCTPDSWGGCLIAYPPEQPWIGDRVNIVLYEPCDTGEGSTGIQMAIVFNSPYSGGGNFMSPEEDSTDIYHTFVPALGCSHIIVIAKSYEVQYSTEFPNGYVIVDVVVTELNLVELSFVGPLHNHALQELTQLGNFPNFSDQEVYDVGKLAIETYYQQNNLGDPQMLPFVDYLLHVNNVLSQGENMSSLFTALKNEDKINQQQLDFLLDINTLFQNADNPNSLADSLFQIEQNIAQFSGLNFNQQALVYGTAVIGRNSANYWYSAYNNPNDPWEGTVPPTAKVKWWQRGLRDLAGFTVGFLAGSLLSGGNPLVGAAGGTLVGTACSAAATT
jgi:hypothetical protein